mgnify:CR=1 FL=1
MKAIKKTHGEIAVSTGMFLLALAFYVMADFKQQINPIDPGPAFFPKLTAAFTMILCMGHIISTIIKDKKGSNKKEKDSGESKADLKLLLLYVLGSLALTVIYIALFEHVNYIILTMAFLLALMFLLGVRKWSTLLSVSFLYAVISYYIFAKVLLVPLTM